MFPVQRGLYGHRSTMNQFAKPGSQFMNFDPFPFTNANLTDLSPKPPSAGMQHQYPSCSSSDDFFDHDLASKEDGITKNISTKQPLSKAERRAEHNAIERARRESLNTKFQFLAQALPNLTNYRRPSKSQIVEKALDWVKQSLSREERYRYQILHLQRENKRLLAQFMSPQENIDPNGPAPVLRQSLSTPTPSSNNATPIPTLYSSASADFNGWSAANNTLKPNQTTPYSSNEDLVKHEFCADDEDNVSSEDDIAYPQFSPYQAAYIDHHLDSPQMKSYKQHRQLMVSELYPVGLSTPADAQFDVSLMPQWSQAKFAHSHVMDPNLNTRSAASLQMLS